MKKGIHFLMIITLVLTIVIGGTGCMENPEETESSHNSTNDNQPSEANSPMQATEPAAYSDKQIVEAVFADYYEYSKADEIADTAAAAMRRAEKLPDRYLGSVTSEDDAKEKAEGIWSEIERGMLEYTREIFENLNQPYIETTFYETYDVWVARTCTSGITEDGKSFGLTGVLEIVIRKSDGKVLAVR